MDTLYIIHILLYIIYIMNVKITYSFGKNERERTRVYYIRKRFKQWF